MVATERETDIDEGGGRQAPGREKPEGVTLLQLGVNVGSKGIETFGLCRLCTLVSCDRGRAEQRATSDYSRHKEIGVRAPDLAADNHDVDERRVRQQAALVNMGLCMSCRWLWVLVALC